MRLGLGMGLMRAGGASVPPWVDPLADIDFALRLQTHRGDGVPLGLYQDTAFTIPATTAGQSIAAWRDELSGSALIATQSVSTKRPTLRFTNGIPWLEFDGIDDWLDVGVMGGQVLYSTGIKSSVVGAWSNYFGTIDKSTDIDGNNRWALFWESRESFLDTDNPPLARANGAEAPVSIGGQYFVPNPENWSSLTVLTKPAAAVNRGIMQFGQTFFGAGGLTSLIMMPADTTEGDIQRVETHITSLAP